MKKRRTKRQIIKDQIADNIRQINRLEYLQQALLEQLVQLNDGISRYEEKEESWGIGKNKVTAMIGRVHWKEIFTDEDTGEKIEIKRSQIIRNGGEWQLGYTPQHLFA